VDAAMYELECPQCKRWVPLRLVTYGAAGAPSEYRLIYRIDHVADCPGLADRLRSDKEWLGFVLTARPITP
jgi:hypothetical protein